MQCKIANRMEGKVSDSIDRCPLCYEKRERKALVCSCGFVFFNICPQCRSNDTEPDGYGGWKCHKCSINYDEFKVMEDLLFLADREYHYKEHGDGYWSGNRGGDHYQFPAHWLKCIKEPYPYGFYYQVGVKKDYIEGMCTDCLNCGTCVYHCPPLLALISLRNRNLISVGVEWGATAGGTTVGYQLYVRRANLERWKKWATTLPKGLCLDRDHQGNLQQILISREENKEHKTGDEKK